MKSKIWPLKSNLPPTPHTQDLTAAPMGQLHPTTTNTEKANLTQGEKISPVGRENLVFRTETLSAAHERREHIYLHQVVVYSN